METVETRAGAERLLLEMMALVVVPDTAGHVRVAVPLVDPKPVKMQAVVFSTPQFAVVKSTIPGVVPPIVPGAANVAPFKSKELVALPAESP